MAPHLIFILLQKSTHSVNMVLSSQSARLCKNCALIRPTKRIGNQNLNLSHLKEIQKPCIEVYYILFIYVLIREIFSLK